MTATKIVLLMLSAVVESEHESGVRVLAAFEADAAQTSDELELAVAQHLLWHWPDFWPRLSVFWRAALGCAFSRADGAFVLHDWCEARSAWPRRVQLLGQRCVVERRGAWDEPACAAFLRQLSAADLRIVLFNRYVQRSGGGDGDEVLPETSVSLELQVRRGALVRLARAGDDAEEGAQPLSSIRARVAAACVALEALALPALVTLEIVDALEPNSVRMKAKWDVIVAVKHFHDRQRRAAAEAAAAAAAAVTSTTATASSTNEAERR